MKHCRITNPGANNIRIILGILEKGPAELTDLALDINCSNSGARRYTERLRDEGIVTLVIGRCGRSPVTTVTLAVDAEGLAAYLDKLKAMTPEPDARVRTRERKIFDEMGAKRRGQKIVPYRDPLVSALFGPALNRRTS